MHRRVIIGKIVGHFLDLFFNARLVSALFCHNKALTYMLFSDRKLGISTAAHRFQRRLDGDGILLAVGNALDAANGIRMSLAHALAPEGIILAVGQNGVAKQTVQREHAGIPADRDHRDMSALACGFIYVFKMLRDLGVGVKAIHHVKALCKRGRLHGQIGRRSPANDHHVNFISHFHDLVGRHHGNPRGAELDRVGVAARKDRHKLHIAVLRDRALHAAPQISITKNTDANAHFYLPSSRWQILFQYGIILSQFPRLFNHIHKIFKEKAYTFALHKTTCFSAIFMI